MAAPTASSSGPSSSVPSPTKDFVKYLPHITKTLDSITTHAANLPGKSDLSFHRTLDRGLAKNLDAASDRVLSMTERLLALVERKKVVAGKGKARRKLEDEDDVTDGYRRGVVGVVDGLLEDADSCLDEINGQKKKAAIAVKPSLAAAAGKKMPGPFSEASSSKRSVPHTNSSAAARLPRPQTSFSDPVDNSLTRQPWSPTLPHKHHAMVPLGQKVPLEYTFVPDPEYTGLQIRLETQRSQHPYYYETRHLSYPTSMFTISTPIIPEPIDSVSSEWVDTPEALAAMVEELKEAREIAVDLEHHNSYSYYGFTCLMQISTRDKDWLVDTLRLRGALREEKLGGVMADPNIIKVFHGADSDIVWLQKDFDLYVVNLFDTFHATKVLEMEHHSLASLLQLYCRFHADKRYQMADWRIRPLTPEMAHYAQADTHFLLYVYDQLRNALLEKSRPPTPDPEAGDTVTRAPSPDTNPQRAMRRVLDLSADTALKLYEREIYEPETGKGSTGWGAAIKKWLPAPSGSKETEAGSIFRQLHIWRDNLAREEDLSPHSIIANDHLKSLSIRPPTGIQALRNVVLPRSPMAGERVAEILEVVTGAKQAWAEANETEPSAKPSNAAASGKVGDHTKFDEKAVVAGPSKVKESPATKAPIQPAQNIQTSLWDFSSSEVEIIRPKASSSLFGGTMAKTPNPVSSAAATSRKSTSSLFGKTVAKAASHQSVNEDMTSFADVLNAVNQSFQPPAIAESAEEDVEMARQEEAGLPEPETVPFVPASFRTTTTTAESTVPKEDATKLPGSAKCKVSPAPDDGIVRVGKKKGKIAQATGEGKISTSSPAPVEEKVHKDQDKPAQKSHSISPTPKENGNGEVTAEKKPKKGKKAKVDPNDIPEFSYESVPNLLDNPSSAASTKKKSRKDKKPKSSKPVLSGTTFGSVPRDNSQPKAGNKSKTFT